MSRYHQSLRFNKWSLLLFLFSLFLLVCSLAAAAAEVPAENVMPVPGDTATFIVTPAADPTINIDPVLANPFGFGSAANGGATYSLSIAISEVSGSVDLYVGVQSDVLGPGIWMLNSDNEFQPLFAVGMIPWQANTNGMLNSIVQEDIPISNLLPGTYNFYLLMTPAGDLGSYRLWVAPLVIQEELLGSSRSWLADWMGRIDDGVRINNIAIPGTHDSAAYQGTGGGGGWVKNQDKSLMEQMKGGIRWFDIRLNLDGSTLTAHHGKWYLDQNFNTELKTALKFLADHPTETIIYIIKQENSSKSDKDFAAAVYKYIKDRGLENFFLDGSYPELNEVRGKIVIFRRFDTPDLGHSLGCKVRWKDNTGGTNYTTDNHNYHVQDNYDRPDLDPKFKHFKDCLGEAIKFHDSSWLFLNFASYFTLGHTNRSNAGNINPKVDELVKKNKGKGGGGVIFLNYAFADRKNLVKHIVEMNKLN